MAETHVITGLVAKRGELAGLIQQYHIEIRRVSGDLEHIDAAIRLFDPDYDVVAIQPRRLREVNPWFAHGEVSTLALDALRIASGEPLSTRQIGEAMVERKGIEIESQREWDRLLKSVLSAMRNLQRRGMVKMVGRVQNRPGGGPMLWKLVD